MWEHIKDKKPIPGMVIEIHYKDRVIECAAAETTVYAPLINEVIKHEDFEVWRYQKK